MGHNLGWKKIGLKSYIFAGRWGLDHKDDIAITHLTYGKDFFTGMDWWISFGCQIPFFFGMENGGSLHDGSLRMKHVGWGIQVQSPILLPLCLGGVPVLFGWTKIHHQGQLWLFEVCPHVLPQLGYYKFLGVFFDLWVMNHSDFHDWKKDNHFVFWNLWMGIGAKFFWMHFFLKNQLDLVEVTISNPLPSFNIWTTCIPGIFFLTNTKTKRPTQPPGLCSGHRREAGGVFAPPKGLFTIGFPCLGGGFRYTPVIKHSNGKSPFSIGNTSSKGSFSIAMLDYQRVFLIFIPTWGNDPIWRAYFSKGVELEPPTNYDKALLQPCFWMWVR